MVTAGFLPEIVMDASIPSLEEPCTPKSKKAKAKSKTKLDSQPSPTRSRRRYDPQRRLEVAETRRNGACVRCREKKVRCSPARHKASADTSPQTSTDTLSNWSRSPRDDDITCTNNDNKDKEIVEGNMLGLDGRIQAAKEYIKVARDHVEEFARFVEIWESSQKQSNRSQCVEEDATVSNFNGITTTGGSPQSSKSSSPIEEDISDFSMRANRTQSFHDHLSDSRESAYIKGNQDIVLSTSTESAAHRQTMLTAKDSNRPLRPKYDLFEKTTPHSPKKPARRPGTKGWRPSLMGENEPWIVTAVAEAPQSPQRTRTTRPSELGGTSDLQGASSETSFEGFQYEVLDNNLAMYGSAMGSGFNFGPCFEQEMPQNLDDPFVSSLMTTQPSLTASELIPTQNPLEYPLTAWESTRDFAQVHYSASNASHEALLNDLCFLTPSTTTPSLDATPWSILSQSLAPLTPQGPSYIPIRKSLDRLIGKDKLEGQHKVLDIDWPFEDFE